MPDLRASDPEFAMAVQALLRANGVPSRRIGLFGVAFIGFAFGPASVLALAPWFIAAGLGIGCVETAQHVAVASFAPTDLRGSAFGLLAAVQAFGNLAASAIAGVIWTVFSPAWAFAYLAGWKLFALIVVLTSHPTRAST